MLQRSALCAFGILLASASFTKDFEDFISKSYGNETLTLLERKDLEPRRTGSFGGKASPNDTIRRRPVLFVHGSLFTASFYLPHAYYFRQHGYKQSELYATTYETNFTRTFFDVEVSCDKIKQVRIFIEVVHAYTASKVDIISWSAGTVIARKALLGGRCLETGQSIGAPLTHLVETYIAVGGITHGLQSCPRNRTACNENSSIYCDSKLIHELNSQKSRYEANYSYGLLALHDEILLDCCNHTCGTLQNAVFSIGLSDYSHLGILMDTMDIQLGLLQHPTLDAFNPANNTSPLSQTELEGAKIMRFGKLFKYNDTEHQHGSRHSI